MTCSEGREQWMLYLDSEGDVELHFRIREHLDGCSECTEWFAKQERWERQLMEHLRQGQPSEELWGRVLSRNGLGPSSPSRRRIFRGLLAASVALIGWVGLLFLAHRENRENLPMPDLTRLTVDCHERHLRGVTSVEFRSTSGREVERFLHRQVYFPVHCPSGQTVAFTPEGCGVCRWAPRPMAYIVGRVEQTTVSVFVLARGDLDAFPRDRDRLVQKGGRSSRPEGAYQLVSGLNADNVVVVVGTAPPRTLEQVLDTYLRDRKE